MVYAVCRELGTESTVAACVCANKRLTFLSSILIRQTVRNTLSELELTKDYVYLLGGIVLTMRSTDKHTALMNKVLPMPFVKVIEHPDIFVRENRL